MQICIDMRPALSKPTGVGVYLEGLVTGLSQIDQENEYHLFSSSWKERFQQKHFGENFYLHDLHWPVSILNFSWHYLGFPKIETLLKTNVHVAHSPTPLLIPASRAQQITTVHDIYFFFHREDTSAEIRRDYPRLLKKHCEKSDAIIAVSEYTKQQLVSHLKIPASKVYTIHHGADPFYAERSSEAEVRGVLKKYGIRPPFFLYVGNREPRKNVPRLLEAFVRNRRDASLVLVGAPPAGPDQSIQPLPANVVETGYISRTELRALYQRALALVVPSLEEGFGLTLLEAMSSRTPVIASATPVFREVAGEAYYCIDAGNAEDLAHAMKNVYDDSELRLDLVRKGEERVKKFDWQDSARKTLEIYQNV